MQQFPEVLQLAETYYGPIPPNPNPDLGAVASVINPRANGYDVTVPIAVQHIISPHQRTAGLPARALSKVVLEPWEKSAKPCSALHSAKAGSPRPQCEP